MVPSARLIRIRGRGRRARSASSCRNLHWVGPLRGEKKSLRKVEDLEGGGILLAVMSGQLRKRKAKSPARFEERSGRARNLSTTNKCLFMEYNLGQSRQTKTNHTSAGLGKIEKRKDEKIAN